MCLRIIPRLGCILFTGSSWVFGSLVFGDLTSVGSFFFSNSISSSISPVVSISGSARSVVRFSGLLQDFISASTGTSIRAETRLRNK